jgi:hypothetical protein
VILVLKEVFLLLLLLLRESCLCGFVAGGSLQDLVEGIVVAGSGWHKYHLNACDMCTLIPRQETHLDTVRLHGLEHVDRRGSKGKGSSVHAGSIILQWMMAWICESLHQRNRGTSA